VDICESGECLQEIVEPTQIIMSRGFGIFLHKNVNYLGGENKIVGHGRHS
jgi:hypothetical protein